MCWASQSLNDDDDDDDCDGGKGIAVGREEETCYGRCLCAMRIMNRSGWLQFIRLSSSY